MKNILRITLLATALSAAFPLVNAATPANVAPSMDPATTTLGARQPRVRGMPHRRAVAHRIARKLDLNQSQIAQLKTIRGSMRTTLHSIRANTGLTPDQKKAQAREALQSSRAQMRALLTPEQQAKLEEMKARAWNRMGGF